MNSAERHEARYQRRRAARLEKRARDTKELGDFESVFSFEHLYAAYRASVKGVGWKASTQRYKASALANIMERVYEEISLLFRRSISHAEIPRAFRGIGGVKYGIRRL